MKRNQPTLAVAHSVLRLAQKGMVPGQKDGNSSDFVPGEHLTKEPGVEHGPTVTNQQLSGTK